MNIIVCVKRVPDSEIRVAIADDGKTLDSQGIKYVLNPYDEFAVEEALKLRETAGEGDVTVMTLGSDDAKETLRTTLAMGADQAVLLKGEPSVDGLGTAEKLAEAIRDRECDLVLFGKQAIDDDNLQVPAMVAELLGLPCATVVVELEVSDGKLEAKREIEGAHELVRFELPGVVAAQKGLNEPRYASLKGIMQAKKKPLEEVDVGTVESRLEVLELKKPEERSGGVIVGEGPDAVPTLLQKLREEAKVL
ncbi:MAG: electron transfer flavoprotein subunit beta/FixA family protein [Gemmatimonadetes bacterium]|uniref:Electron transfer flavoprotein subunit beta n=1 Tax=Candidatus Kutchimonas denitrificans TaxID=3056748 RepID=A0AAE4Z8V1_9BACT|nr:electron transfer flavoprotein subunit beta/FixA family protein [Gemmatimonadota bacterium]NIR75424.1 electron transfer flavoprotein subunit beta/FixA family protein [Candidatus Kutchimonas denitrificans]NIS01738.1 electron transfer flavoprotein subunit beta/FixA family protein [Gemmatimonadota bacterium]NIT67520.1 electron transfer flavoprotein subunit beta/FixA family protein [Gemmatimonadota bacterium]NIU53383.1 electron transfer flavoprotein beta subunit/FixA family protein [Gemmatimonad